jgi:hypothetical protein
MYVCFFLQSYLQSSLNSTADLYSVFNIWRGLAVPQLRHCATTQKVMGSIPDGVIGIFHWLNAYNHTMSLGMTEPLTEMSTRDFSWEKSRSVYRADNLITFIFWLSGNSGILSSWIHKGTVQACNWIALPLLILYKLLGDILPAFIFPLLYLYVRILYYQNLIHI